MSPSPKAKELSPTASLFVAACNVILTGPPTPGLSHMTRAVTITADPEPDQQPHRWDEYVPVYEDVFEPLTQSFSLAAIEALAPEPQSHVLDSAAGAGGAALELARRGHR